MAENVAEPSARRRRTRQQLLGAIRQHPGVTRGERAIDFGHSHVFVAVADTSGRVLADECQTADVDQHSTDALDAAADLLTRCLGAAGLTVSDLAGVAAGIPCPLDANTGVVRSPTILADWVDLHPAAELAARIGRPVHVDNDANMEHAANSTSAPLEVAGISSTSRPPMALARDWSWAVRPIAARSASPGRSVPQAIRCWPESASRSTASLNRRPPTRSAFGAAELGLRAELFGAIAGALTRVV